MCWDGSLAGGSTVKRLLGDGCDGGGLMFIEEERSHLPALLPCVSAVSTCFTKLDLQDSLPYTMRKVETSQSRPLAADGNMHIVGHSPVMVEHEHVKDVRKFEAMNEHLRGLKTPPPRPNGLPKLSVCRLTHPIRNLIPSQGWYGLRGFGCQKLVLSVMQVQDTLPSCSVSDLSTQA